MMRLMMISGAIYHFITHPFTYIFWDQNFKDCRLSNLRNVLPDQESKKILLIEIMQIFRVFQVRFIVPS